MMQNSSLSAMLLNPKIMDIPQRSISRGADKSDDTFMNMLNERLQSRQVTGAKSRPAQKVDFSVRADKPSVDYKKAEVKRSDSKIGSAEPISTEKAAKTEASGEVSRTDKPKDTAKETIMTLESMIALLEELLEKLDVKAIEAGTSEPLNSETATELMPDASGNVNPVQLLKALLEGNTEKLNSLMAKIDETQLPAEFDGLMEKIRGLLEKIAGTQDIKAEVMVLNPEEANSKSSSEELLNQLKSQISDVVAKLKERVSELKTVQAQGSSEETQIPVSNISESGQTSCENEADASKQEAKSETKADPKVSELNEKPLNAANSQHPVNGKEAMDNSEVNAFAIPAEQKSSDVTGARLEKTPLPLTEKPLAQTVTNQVMMKVKLMTGQNKQEMEMHLKPESLGKLSLKIIHERGEILAKITAENEQVKGILESNMQLLKDALEKSGLTVQSLSVSVGNGQDRNPSGQDANGNFRNSTRGLSESFKASNATETLEARTKIRDFYGQTSQINLTA